MTAASLFIVLLLGALAWAAPTIARAQSCNVAVTDVAFGAYDPTSAVPRDANGSVQVECMRATDPGRNPARRGQQRSRQQYRKPAHGVGRFNCPTSCTPMPRAASSGATPPPRRSAAPPGNIHQRRGEGEPGLRASGLSQFARPGDHHVGHRPVTVVCEPRHDLDRRRLPDLQPLHRAQRSARCGATGSRQARGRSNARRATTVQRECVGEAGHRSSRPRYPVYGHIKPCSPTSPSGLTATRSTSRSSSSEGHGPSYHAPASA